jgi:hypothetical protein
LFKFILAVVGYFLLGKSIGGGILGFFVGTFIDNYQKIKVISQQQGGGKGFSAEDMFSYYQQRTTK